MGQTISRRLAGRLERGMQRHRKLMEEDALRDIAEKKRASGSGFSDPSAVDTGFQRGRGQDSFKDTQQEKYFEEVHAEQQTNTELPDDLIQFLKDAGPLERKVDKDFTSPRLRQKLDLEEGDKDPHRQLKQMPIMEGSDFSTSRTTNFSTLDEDDDEGTTGLTYEQIHNLLRDQGENNTSIIDEERYLKEEMDEATKEEQLKLIKQTLQYLAIPVLMKENNDNVVGTHVDRVPDLQRMYKLKLVPDNRIKIVLDAQREGDKSEP